ncbi:MAG: hypothetical protein ACI9U2_001828, partial [Bradymonadia bacterium]
HLSIPLKSPEPSARRVPLADPQTHRTIAAQPDSEPPSCLEKMRQPPEPDIGAGRCSAD